MNVLPDSDNICGQFQNQPLIGWLKKIQNREQNFITWNSYIHNCITSPHSCHPHLGTCTMTLVFVVTHQRMVTPSYAASC